VPKNIGYELRCADPIPFDMEYTRDLGYCAASTSCRRQRRHDLDAGRHFVPIPFSEMIDAKTGRTKIRLVDIHSTRYAIARRYMLRLRRDDFEDPHELRSSRTPDQHPAVQGEFEPLVASEPPRSSSKARHLNRRCTTHRARTDPRADLSCQPGSEPQSADSEVCRSGGRRGSDRAFTSRS